MALGFDFGGGSTKSPYLKRQSQVYSNASGRPTESQPSSGATVGELGNTPYAGFLKALTQPIRYQDRSQQRWNVARGQIQTGNQAGMGALTKVLGGRGFRGGESGYADTAYAGETRAGSERLTRAASEIETSEADRAMQYSQLNLQRMGMGGGLALQGEEGALNREFGYYRSKLDAETEKYRPWWQALSTGGEYVGRFLGWIWSRSTGVV